MSADGTTAGRAAEGPPRWLIVSTITLAVLTVLMAVAETTVWIHFVVDRGEAVSLVGLAFITLAGLHLYRQERLWRSLPLVLPWALYPVITQGDQLIDNLTINQMRLVVHVILALLFGGPVVALVVAFGRTSARAVRLALALLAVEAVIAYLYLGTLMLATLAVMAAGVGAYAWIAPRRSSATAGGGGKAAQNRLALGLLVGVVAASLGLYVGFKNRSGAYQGSPHFFYDPAQRDAAYSADAIVVAPGDAVRLPADSESAVRALLTEYASVLEQVLGAYYVMDRNYNYWFHNELFLRNTPVLPGFRETSLAAIARAGSRAEAADARLERVLSGLPPGHPLASLLEEAAAYTAYNLRRAAILERMSGEFVRSTAGLQHATHLYEGEGKAVGTMLSDLLVKHQRVIAAAPSGDVAAPFTAAATRIAEAYATRIVGF